MFSTLLGAQEASNSGGAWQVQYPALYAEAPLAKVAWDKPGVRSGLFDASWGTRCVETGGSWYIQYTELSTKSPFGELSKVAYVAFVKHRDTQLHPYTNREMNSATRLCTLSLHPLHRTPMVKE
jgi:hypothetical protein